MLKVSTSRKSNMIRLKKFKMKALYLKRSKIRALERQLSRPQSSQRVMIMKPLVWLVQPVAMLQPNLKLGQPLLTKHHFHSKVLYLLSKEVSVKVSIISTETGEISTRINNSRYTHFVHQA